MEHSIIYITYNTRAWPVSLFLGAEYFLIFYLVRFYFKENIINDQININEKEISIQKYKNNKLFYSLKLNTYWSKVFFYKNENKSRLTIRESNKEAEVASFLHSNIKESLYNKISKQINYYN